ncbi:MAG: tetratricopeptide repeat protein, partial [Planctomycetota bacterium]
MWRSSLLLSLLLLIPSSPAHADARSDLFLALDRERTEGKIEEALALYRRAAESSDREVRGWARLGEGRCLRRLGRTEEARKVLEALVAAAPPDEVAAAAGRELELAKKGLVAPEVARSEEERLRSDLVAAQEEARDLRERLARAEGTQEEVERLKAELTEKDALVGELTSRIEAAAREERQREKEAAHRAELVAFALAQARTRYREARFDEALDWVRKALEQDPTNAEARELFSRLGDPLGDRERLVIEVLRLFDAERRLRLDELRLEVDALLSKGQEQLLRGELDPAVDSFRECLALVEANASFARDLVVRRERADAFLKKAIDRGGEGSPPPAEPAAPGVSREARWRETLGELLEDLVSSPRAGGGLLKVYGLGELDDPARSAPPTPGALAPTVRRPPPGELLVRLIPLLVHPPAWREGDHILRSQGSDLVVFAPEEIQRGVAGLLQKLTAAQDEPTQVSVTCFGVDPAVLAAGAAEAGREFTPRGSAAVAVLDRGSEERLLASLGEAEVLGRVETVVPPGRTLGLTHLRSFAIAPPAGPGSESAARHVEHGLTASLLPVRAGTEYGVALVLEAAHIAGTASLPTAGGARTEVPSVAKQRCAVAVRVPPGGSLAVAGLVNPFAERPFPRRPGLLVII